jgi:hypothetical protein
MTICRHVTSLTLPHFCAYSKPEKPDIQRHMSWSFLRSVSSVKMIKIIVHFVDIGEIVKPSLFKLSFHNVHTGKCNDTH